MKTALPFKYYCILSFRLIALLSGTITLAQNPIITYNPQTTYYIGQNMSLTPTIGGATIVEKLYVTTIAGSNAPGFKEGIGSSARFGTPTSITVDNNGYLYLTDRYNEAVQKISPQRAVSTITVGAAVMPEFFQGIALNSTTGDIYFVDYTNNVIKKITFNNNIATTVTFAGQLDPGSNDGSGGSAKFSSPAGLAIDSSGNLYVADQRNNKIRKITPDGVVTTFAGSGTDGSVNGIGAQAQFSGPSAICISPNGNFLYVADQYISKIRKINISTAEVSTLAGSGTIGFLDGTATNAQFNDPWGLAADNTGNVYVVDASNNRIRMVSPTGVVTTLAGSGTNGFVDGLAANAQFSYPNGITTDSNGNIFIADYGNHRIRKISSAKFSITPALPAGMAFNDQTGAITGTPLVTSIPTEYTIFAKSANGSRSVTISFATSHQSPVISSYNEKSNYCVGGPMELTPTITGDTPASDLIVSTTAGLGMGNNGGTTDKARFKAPSGVTVDSNGNIYIADSGNHKIKKITTAGDVKIFAGPTQTNGNRPVGFADGSPENALFNNPSGVAFDNTNKILYVTDTDNHAIRKITTDINGDAVAVSTLAGSGTLGFQDGTGAAAQFNRPWGIVVDATGNVYVADTYNHRIRKITPAGIVTTFAGSGTAGLQDGIGTAAKFYYPIGMTMDTNGYIYVGDNSNSRVRKISPSGEVTTLGTVSSPYGIAIDDLGNIYTATKNYNKIEKISSEGVVSTLIVGQSIGSYIDGPADEALFDEPVGLAFYKDSNGNRYIYVADSQNHKIRNIHIAIAYTITPSLPNGLVLNSTSGIISGTPTVTTPTTTYTVTASNLGGSSSKTISFATSTTSTGPTAAAEQNFCGTATVANLVPSGASYNWYASNTSSTPLAGTTVLTNNTTYYVSFAVGNSCDNARTAVLVKLNQSNAPSANAEQTFCNAATVANLSPSGANYKWYATNTSTTALTETAALTDNTTYYVAMVTNNCETPRTVVLVKINQPGNPPTATAEQTFCNAATVANLSPSGANYKWYATNTSTTPLAGTTALTHNTNYYVSMTNNGCETTRTMVLVKINQPTAPTADAEQTFCNAATIANLTPSGANYNWYTSNTSTTPLTSTTALTNNTSYYVSVVTNNCESTRTTVLVQINQSTAPSPQTEQTFCNAATIANLVPSGANYKWYATNTSTTPLAGTIALSNNTTYYVAMVNNNCESPRTAVLVKINQPGNPPTATAEQTFCNAATVANLSPSGANYKWYTSNTSTATLAGTTALSHNTNYYVSMTNNGCETARTMVLVKINQPTAPTADAEQIFCNAVTVADLTPSGPNYNWYISNTSTTPLSSTTVLTNNTTYYVSIVINNCESTRTAVLVKTNSTAPTAQTEQTFCNTATIANLTPSGPNYKWYASNISTTALVSTATLTHNTTYYVAMMSNNCETMRTAVLVKINQAGNPPTATAEQTFCNAATVANLNPSGANYKWYATNTSTAPLTGTTVLSHNTNYYVSMTNNGCETTRTIVLVKIIQPTAPTTNAEQSFCGSTTVASLVPSGANYKWYDSNTSITPLVTTAILNDNTSYYVSMVTNGCESTRIAVLVKTNTIAPTAQTEQNFCNAATIANLSPSGTNYKWYASNTSATPLTSTVALNHNTNYYVAMVNNNCETPRTAVLVKINQSGNPPIVATEQNLCSGTTIASLLPSGTNYKWYDSNTSPTPLLSSAILTNNTTYYVSMVNSGCETTRAAVLVKIGPPIVYEIDSHVSCGSYTWIDGNTYTTNNNTATFEERSATNCISKIKTLNLIIRKTPNTPTGLAIQQFNPNSTLANLEITGNNIKWYADASSATPLEISTILVDGNSYYASQSNSDCESTGRLAVLVSSTGVPLNVDFKKDPFPYAPNPVVDTFTVAAETNITNIVVYNNLGQAIYNLNPNTLKASIDLSILESGNYYISITSKNNKKIIKIIKP